MNYKRLMKPYRADMIDAMRRLVAIPSVYDEKTKTKSMPFGKEVSNALNYVAELGERYGFDVEKCDGYATEITIGQGDKMIGIFAHTDVVPASGNWENDPFKPVIENGRMYGRGTSDDKGPFVAAFYAAKALNDLGMLRDCKVRIVVGGDEERGSSCLEHYFHDLKKPYPDYGFTPDSDFPLIYGEKGIRDFYPSLKISIPHVKSIKGGVATNAVCDKVEIVLDDATELKTYLGSTNLKYEVNDNKVIIYGKSCHGSMPSLGVNAALITLETLGKVYKVDKLVEIASKLSDTTGKAFDGFRSTKLLGETTYCVGMINYEKGVLKFTVNFRYPEKVDSLSIIKHFDEVFGTQSEVKGESPNLLYDPKSDLVKTLLKAYRAETFDFRKPLTTGGGTYAKHSKNTIAFGALFPNRESRMHEPNEYMLLKDVYKSAEIYAHAIDLLRKLK